MSFLVAMIVQVLAGIGAGYAALHVLKADQVPAVTLVLAGALGGIAGGTLLGAVFGLGSVDPAVTASAVAGFLQVVGQIVGAVLGGGALTGLIARVIRA